MPPKGRKKAAVTKSYSAEVDAEFPPIEKLLQDKSQPAKSGRGRKKADAADDETIIVGQVGLVEDDVGNGISNGTKMNGGGTSNNEEKMDPFDKLLLESTTKKDDWRLEFSPDASRMSPKNGAEKESGDLESDEEDFKTNSKTSSVVAEAGSTRAKEEIEQVSDEEVEDAPEEADEESEDVLKKSSDEMAVEEEPEEEIEESQEEDEPEEPNVEVEQVPEKRGRKKVMEKAPEEDIEEVEKTEEPEKAVGRRGRKKAEVVTEEPKKTLVKRGRKKAEVVEEQEEIDDDDEPEEEEKPAAKRGRKKAEIPEEVDNDEQEEEKPTAKRGRRKAEIPEEVDDDEPEEEKPTAKRGRRKADIPEEVDDDEIEEDKEKPVTKRGRKKLEDVEEEPPKSKRGRKKAEVLDIADEESEKEQEKPAPKRGRRKAEGEVVEIPDEEEEDEKPKGRRGRPAKAAEIEDSQEPEKTRAVRGRKKTEVVEVEEEKPVAKRGRKKAEVPEVAEEPEKTTGKRGRKKAEVVETETVEEPAKGKKGRKRKVDVPESPSKRGKEEDYAEDDISDFAGKELRVAMTRNQEIDEMARKASPPHKGAGNVQKPSDETYVMAKPAKEQPAKSGRKRANQDTTEAKSEKIQKEEPAKQGKSGAKRAQIPDVSALDFGSDAKTKDDQPWNFKIASWNVNGVRAWLEKNGMSYLKHEDPDVLCIQETKCSKDKLPEELQIDGYHCHWLAGDKEGYSGVGLISKTKPVSITEGIGIEEHDNEGRVITAEFEKFYLVNTYVPNSGRGLVRLDYRKTWDEDFRAYLKELDSKKPVVLCGDLNVAHEEIDIANPKSNKKNAGFTQEERDGFSALLEEGFIDTFRHLYPDEKGAYTFWTYMMNCRAKNVGWRLDYFVISERFKDHLCDSLIRKDVMGSDHCPVGLLLHI